MRTAGSLKELAAAEADVVSAQKGAILGSMLKSLGIMAAIAAAIVATILIAKGIYESNFKRAEICKKLH